MGLMDQIGAKLTRAWLARQPITALAARLRARGGVTGLSYHAVSDGFDGYPFVTAPAAFEAHLAFLKETFDIRPLSAVVEALNKGLEPNSGKPLAFLSFDDAYLDTLSTAAPILERAGLPATLFAPRDLVEGPGTSHMTPADLREIAAHPLWEIGGHGLTHNVLPAFSPADIARELAGSKAWLEDLTGRSAPGFAYPQGAISAGVVAETGRHYRYAVSTDRRLGPAYDPLQIRRHCPTRADDPVAHLAQALVLAPFETGHPRP